MPPIFILIVELILLLHALTINHPDIMVVELTSVLLFISIFEMILVSIEMHDHYQTNNLDRVLTIKIDDFIMGRKREKNVKTLVEEFINQNPKYKKHRNKIYHICCQVMQTHEEEAMEKELESKLKKFIKKRKQRSVDDLLKDFIKKYPKYRKFRQKVYQKICTIKGAPFNNK